MQRCKLALALLATTTLLASACVSSDEDTSILILQNQLPTAECGPQTDPSAPFLPRGLVDTNSPNGYVLSPIVQNSASTVDSTVSQLYLFEGADIDLTPQSGFFSEEQLAALNADNQLSFSQRFSGIIMPDGGVTMMIFEIMSKSLLDTIGATLPTDGTVLQVKAEIQVFGQMHGGGLKSQKFTYWVDVCNGCLTANNLGSCSAIPTGFVAGQGSCFGLQDAELDCCTDDDTGAVICPATAGSTGS